MASSRNQGLARCHIPLDCKFQFTIFNLENARGGDGGGLGQEAVPLPPSGRA